MVFLSIAVIQFAGGTLFSVTLMPSFPSDSWMRSADAVADRRLAEIEAERRFEAVLEPGGDEGRRARLLKIGVVRRWLRPDRFRDFAFATSGGVRQAASVNLTFMRWRA